MPTAVISHQPDSNWKGSGIEHLVGAKPSVFPVALARSSLRLYDDGNRPIAANSGLVAERYSYSSRRQPLSSAKVPLHLTIGSCEIDEAYSCEPERRFSVDHA
jgi:hypothetical protein